MAILFYLLLPLALIGQLAISIAIVNRIHSLGYPRWMLKTGDYVCYLLTIATPIFVIARFFRLQSSNEGLEIPLPLPPWMATYFLACLSAVLLFVATRLYHNISIKTTSRLLSNHTRVTHVMRDLGHRPVNQTFTHLCSRLPFNEILQLSIHDKEIRLPRLDPRLDGLRITHLSDLHMTGQLTKSFYEEVVRRANETDADIVALTGDIVEKVPCLDWIADTLGQLQSRYGTFFVLGNHEKRIHNEALIRDTFTSAGIIDLGSQWHVLTHNGQPFVLGGNELPWYKPAVDFSDSPSAHADDRPFRILLSHSPDQLEWAREHDCDLMLAGHTHGGQVRLPIIGPIVAPSRMGTRFASGTFYFEPTLMHVSRGIAGTRPLRLNCRPEITHLVLKSDAS